MNNKKILTALIPLLILMFIGFSSAANPYQGVFNDNQTVVIKQTCIVNSTECDRCNITRISYPNSSLARGQSPMVKDGTVFTYDFNNSFTNKVYGDYLVDGFCEWSGVKKTFTTYFTITPTGKLFDSGQGFVSLGILGSALVLAFFFLWLGFRLEEIKPLALFFAVIGLFLAIYSLQLGLSFSIDLLYYDELSNMQRTMYISILWLVVGIILISFILMMFGFVREFGKGKMMKDYGDGFDPISQTYQ